MKKLTALILSIIMLIGALPAFAAGNEPIILRDTNKLDVVKSLGILDAYANYEPDESAMTRGEFAYVMSRLMNITLPESTESAFADVTNANPYFDAIMAMANQKIMVGDGMGNFCPDEPVMVASAAKCLLHILGYGTIAEVEGYPNGCINRARRLDIFDGMAIDAFGAVSRSALAEMIYNALDVIVLEPVSFGNMVEHSPEKGETILTKYHDIVKKEGIVNAVDGRSIKTNVLVSDEGFVQIDDVLYQYSDTGIVNYLGYKVEYYVTEESENEAREKLICFIADEDNVELMIPVKDLDTSSPRFTLRNFCYTDSKDKKREAKITDKLRFVYNGAYDLDFDVPDLNFQTGYVKLVDNNNDDIYDVVLIWSYENYVADTISDNKILCHYNKMLKKDEDNLYRVLGENGVWGGWELLSAASNWTVLSVATSKDGTLVTIHMSNGGVSGTIEAMSTDESIKVVIDGMEYTVSGAYPLLSSCSDYVELKPGVESEFYFDIMGEIAGVYTVRTTEFQYGYLLRVAPVDEESYKYSYKIFTTRGKAEYFYAKDRIRLKSGLYNSKISSDVAYGEFRSGRVTNQQLIRYKTDEEGTLTAIETAVNATNMGYDSGEFSKDFDIGSTEYRYQDATSTFGDKDTFNNMFHIGSMTIVFYLPTQGGVVSEDNATVTNATLFSNGNHYTDMKVYDCDETYQASVLVYNPVMAGSGITSVTSEYYIAVSKVYGGLDEDGLPVEKLRGFYRGVEKEWEYISADGSRPERGSVIKCEETLTGELVVRSSNVQYSPTTSTAYYNGKNGTALPVVWSQYGRLFRKNGSAITVYDGSAKPIANYLNSGFAVYKVSPEKVSVSSEAELYNSTGVFGSDGRLISGAINGTLMLLNNRYQYVREIFIIDEDY